MAPRPKQKRERQRHFIREWRKFRGKTQEDAAEFLGADQSTVSNLERGKTPYDQDVLERLAVFYGCDPEDLLSNNPFSTDLLKVVWSDLEKAPSNVKAQALGYIEALLKKTG